MFVKIADFIKFEGLLVEFLGKGAPEKIIQPPENRRNCGFSCASPFAIHLVCTLLTEACGFGLYCLSQIQGDPGSVRLPVGGGTVQTVPVLGSGGSSGGCFFLMLFSVFSTVYIEGRFEFRFLKMVPRVPAPLSVSGQTVPMVPVSRFRFGFLATLKL